MAAGDHFLTAKLTYWDASGNEHWLAFPFPEHCTGDQLMEQLRRRVPEVWFQWRVNMEAVKLGREHGA